jgi:hypothetical protein
MEDKSHLIGSWKDGVMEYNQACVRACKPHVDLAGK